MFGKLIKHSVAKIVLVIYFVLFIFWAWLNILGFEEGFFNNLFGALYPVISLIGGFFGLFVVSKKWGSGESVLGRGILFLSLGLLGEAFGQLAWSYYTIILNVEIPYPSIADIGYFSIIPFYGFAMFNFARAVGVSINLSSYLGKLQAFIVPIIMVLISYFLFLRNVQLDLSNPLRTFLDFGYPGFEAIAVSLGILTYSLSRGVLGGIMKQKILFLVFALIAQYVTDYTFLYSVGLELYNNGGLVDLMYMTSITLMVLGITVFLDLSPSKKAT